MTDNVPVSVVLKGKPVGFTDFFCRKGSLKLFNDPCRLI
jgi:hypothetical protein